MSEERLVVTQVGLREVRRPCRLSVHSERSAVEGQLQDFVSAAA